MNKQDLKDSSAIKKIQKEETNSEERINRTHQSFNEKINDRKSDLDKDLEAFDKDLRQVGGEKLKVVKQKAAKQVKEKIGLADKERRNTIDQANAKKPQAVESIVSSFFTLIKL